MTADRTATNVHDRVALDVVARLRRSFQDLASHVGPYDNLVGVFFHELVVYATNYYLIRVADERYDLDVRFPYLNTDYVEKPWPLRLASPSVHRPGRRRRTLEVLRIPRAMEALSAVLPHHASVALPRRIRELRRLVPALLGHASIRFEEARTHWTGDRDRQLAALRGAVEDIATVIGANRPATFSDNFMRYASNYVAEGRPRDLADLLIAGSGAILEHRILRARYLQCGRPVVALAHGEQCALTLDDPYTGYGELSYCTHFLSYGTADIGRGKHNHTLQEWPTILRRTSETIEKYYEGPSVPHVPITPDTRILYVPTVSSQTTAGGNIRYGPFRDIEDHRYKRWQEALVRHGHNVTYKVHPISDPLVSLSGTAGGAAAAVVECLADYDASF